MYTAMRWVSILLCALSCVGQIPTTTTLLITPNPVNVGASTTATVTVTPAATGTITIQDRGQELTRRVLTNSAATVPLTFKTPGVPFLRAIYIGSAAHSRSASAEVRLTVRSPSVMAFLAPAPLPASSPSPDLNYDGIPDSYTVSGTTISIRFGTSGGALGNPVTSNLPAGYAFSSFADFNGDGRVDVLARDASGYVLEVFAGGAGGTITGAVLDRIYSTGYPVDVFVFDANADGFPDVAYSVHQPFAGIAEFRRFSDGKGKFLPESDFKGGSYLGDRNGDGLPEFARSYRTYIGRYLGPIRCVVHFSPTYLNETPCGAGYDASLAGVVDVDGDGLLDVISFSSHLYTYADTVLALLRANPLGNYHPVTIYVVPPGQNTIGVADMNGDGREDVVSRQTNSIVVRFGLAAGTLSGPVVLSAPGMTLDNYARIEDATGDGVPDILMDVNSQLIAFAGVAGLIAPPSAPGPVSVTSGAGLTGVLVAKYQDTNGAVDLSLVNLLVSTGVNGANACLIEVNTVSRTIRLMNDAGDGWTNLQPVAPFAEDLSNSQCTVIPGSMSIESVGNEVTVRAPIKFSPSFAGGKKIYLKAVDAGGLESLFEERGQWNIVVNQHPPTIVPAGVSVSSLEPVAGQGNAGRFTAVFQHGEGKHYLGYILLLPTPNVVQYTALGSCLIEYNRISNGMRLINDAGNGWLGPISGVVIGPGAQNLENSQCSLHLSSASAQVTTTTMVVEASVTFKAGMAGVLSTFLQAFDTDGKYTGMTQFGNWVTPGTDSRSGPKALGLGLDLSAGVYNLSAAAGHTAGTAGLAAIHVRIGPKIVGAPVCHLVYVPSTKTMNLVNDSEAGVVSGTWIEPGAGTLSNSYCSIFGGGAFDDGNSSHLNVKVKFNPVTFSGVKYVYMNVFDKAGLLTHWVTVNSVTVE